MNNNLTRKILLVVSFILFLVILIIGNFSNLVVAVIPLIYAALIVMYKYTKKKTSLYNILVYTLTIPAFSYLVYFFSQLYLIFTTLPNYNIIEVNHVYLLCIILFVYFKDIIELFYKQNFSKKTNTFMSINYIIIILTAIKYFYFVLIDPNEAIGNSIITNYTMFTYDLLFICILYSLSTVYKHLNK